MLPFPRLPEQRAIAHALRTVQAVRKARRREATLERDRQIGALIALLDEAVALLEHHGINRWATWMRRGVDGLRDGEPSTVDYILHAYGGMGSFTDFWVAGPDGARIDELRTAIYDAARTLRARRERGRWAGRRGETEQLAAVQMKAEGALL